MRMLIVVCVNCLACSFCAFSDLDSAGEEMDSDDIRSVPSSRGRTSGQ